MPEKKAFGSRVRITKQDAEDPVIGSYALGRTIGEQVTSVFDMVELAKLDEFTMTIKPVDIKVWSEPGYEVEIRGSVHE